MSRVCVDSKGDLNEADIADVHRLNEGCRRSCIRIVVVLKYGSSCSYDRIDQDAVHLICWVIYSRGSCWDYDAAF